MTCRPLPAAGFLLCGHPAFPHGAGAASSPANSRHTPSGNGAVRFSASTHLRAGVYTLHCWRWAFLLYGVPGFPVWDWRCHLPDKFPAHPIRERGCSLLRFRTPGSRGIFPVLLPLEMGFSAVQVPGFPVWDWRCHLPGKFPTHRITHIKRTDPSEVCPFCHIWDQSTMALTASMRSTTASRGTRAQELPSTTARQESPS